MEHAKYQFHPLGNHNPPRRLHEEGGYPIQFRVGRERKFAQVSDHPVGDLVLGSPVRNPDQHLKLGLDRKGERWHAATSLPGVELGRAKNAESPEPRSQNRGAEDSEQGYRAVCTITFRGQSS